MLLNPSVAVTVVAEAVTEPTPTALATVEVTAAADVVADDGTSDPNKPKRGRSVAAHARHARSDSAHGRLRGVGARGAAG